MCTAYCLIRLYQLSHYILTMILWRGRQYEYKEENLTVFRLAQQFCELIVLVEVPKDLIRAPAERL